LPQNPQKTRLSKKRLMKIPFYEDNKSTKVFSVTFIS